MIHRLLSSAALVAFSSFLSAKDLPVTSTISSVKVFLSGAEITRTAKASLASGTSTLVFTNLSEEVDPGNIQVNGQGAFTILSVTHRLNYIEEKNDRKEVKDLETRIATTEADIAHEQALLGVLVKEEERLAKNDVIGGNQGASLEQLRATNDYMQQRLETIALGQLTRQARIKELNEALTELRGQLTQLKGKKPAPTSEVVVEVTCTTAVEAKFTLKYQVRSAGWSPSYDIRVIDITQPLELTYKALVYQNSGEEWNDVALSLSSGDPNKGALMPLLSTWLLDFGARTRPVAAQQQRAFKPGIHDVRGIVRNEKTGEPLPFVNVQLVDANGTMINGTTTNFDGYYAIAIPDGGHELRFSYIGYKTQGTPVFAGTINQSLTPEQTELDELVIAERKSANVSMFSPVDIQRIPAMGGSAEGFYRGSRAEEGYYIDGVKVASGGVPANYGNASGGTANISANASVADNVIARATNFEFAIKVPYTIPSDGQNHHVGVQEQKLDAQYRYYCTPKLDLDAFLFAKVTKWESLNLLPGPAHIYFEGTYVGESELDLSAVGDTLDLSLGRDKGVTVQRTKRKDFSQKQTVGSKRTDSISWEIAVRNNKAQAVQLIVTDQYPVAARSEIEVELVESSAAKVNEEKGFLTWKKSIEPRTNTQWVFTYSVKYPKEGVVWLE
jgi:hypothetical protein